MEYYITKMVEYYRTPSGLFYKQYTNGKCVRVSRSEYNLTGGASKSPKNKKSKSKSRRSPKTKIVYTPAEQQCIDWVQAKIAENKKLPKGTFQHIGHLVAISYEQARAEHPECGDFFDREKVRKAAAKAARKKSKAKSRRKRRRTRSKKAKGKKSSSRKSATRKSGSRKSATRKSGSRKSSTRK